MSDFPCTQCGLCCRQVGRVLEHKEYWDDPVMRQAIDEFPYGVTRDGTCEMLINNKCSVYDNRPLICDIAKLAAARGFDVNQWYRISAAACNFLIRQAGLDESYLIKDYDLQQ